MYTYTSHVPILGPKAPTFHQVSPLESKVSCPVWVGVAADTATDGSRAPGGGTPRDQSLGSLGGGRNGSSRPIDISFMFF